jgi:hypothetical protein
MIAQSTPSWLVIPPPAPPLTVIRVDVVQHDSIPWVALLSAVVAIVAALIAWRNLAAARSKLQVDGIINLTRDSGTPQFQDAVKKILTLHYTSAMEYSHKTNSLPDDERAALADQMLLVTQFFDKIGYLVRKKYLDETLIRATYGTYIVEVWEHTKAILTSSKRTDADVYPNNFKWLAERTGSKIQPYNEMVQNELAARFKRMADGTATEEDKTFG